jgi:hypothetical protein
VKTGILSCLFIGVGWAVLAIVQLWLQPLSADVFLKVSITLGIVLAAIIVVTLVVKEYVSEQKLKKDGFIDG